MPQIVRFGRGRRFDCALAHGSTDLPPACRVLGIPNTTMLDYEWATLQHHLNCRLAIARARPGRDPAERLARYGARPPKLVPYPGLKEEYYLSDFEPDHAVLGRLGVDPADELLCVVRTAPSYALYLRRAPRTRCCPALLARLAAARRRRPSCWPRTPEQRQAIAALGPTRVIVPERAVDGRSLVAFADLLVSAGRHDEPRGGRARHARLVDLRGQDGRGRRDARARRAGCGC